MPVIYSVYMARRYIIAAVLCFVFACVSCGSSCRDNDIEPPKRVVLYVIDTLRKDHVSAYGYEKQTTPAFDRIARQGVLFERAVAASSWTQPSMASLFTSTYPLVHHVNKAPSGQVSMAVLPPDLVTIPELMKQEGYKTHAVSSQPWISAVSGFDQGFDGFELVSDMLDAREAEKVMDRAIKWMSSSSDDKFFLYIHVMGPHWPYNPPDEARHRFTSSRVSEVRDFFEGKDYHEQYDILNGKAKSAFASDPALLAELVALYDEDAAFSDRQLARLWKALEQKGMQEDTMLIVCSDHGEEFLEHGGFLHGFNLFAESTDVPLLIYYPPLGKGLRRGTVVSLIDVLPTLADLLGVDPPEPSQGKSLLPVVLSGQETKSRLSELVSGIPHHTPREAGQGRVKLNTTGHSLIYRPEDENKDVRSWLFDIKSDPLEQSDLSAENPRLAEELTGKLLEMEYENLKIEVPPAKHRKIPPDHERQLKALGYLR